MRHRLVSQCGPLASRHTASLQTPEILLGRALATLGTAPTKNAIAELAN